MFGGNQFGAPYFGQGAARSAIAYVQSLVSQSSQAISFLRQGNKFVSFTASVAGAISRRISKSIAALSGYSGSILKRVGLSLSIPAGSLGTISNGLSKTLVYASTQAALIAKQVSKLIAYVNTVIASFGNSFTVNLSAMVAYFPSFSREIAKELSVASYNTASAIKAVYFSMVTSVATYPLILKSFWVYLTALSDSASSVLRQVGITLGLSAVYLSNISSGISKAVSYTSVLSASLYKMIGFERLVLVSSVSEIIKDVSVSLSAFSDSLIRFSIGVGKWIVSTTLAIAGFSQALAYGIYLAIYSDALPLLTKEVSKSILSYVIQVNLLVKSAGITIAINLPVLANLLSGFVLSLIAYSANALSNLLRVGKSVEGTSGNTAFNESGVSKEVQAASGYRALISKQIGVLISAASALIAFMTALKKRILTGGLASIGDRLAHMVDIGEQGDG